MLHKQRQVAGMIQVGVRQDDGIDPPRADRKRRPVPKPERLESWKRPQSTRTRRPLPSDQEFGSCYSAGSAQEQ
jgi:hypothetical protein